MYFSALDGYLMSSCWLLFFLSPLSATFITPGRRSRTKQNIGTMATILFNCLCQSPGFDTSILRHSWIWAAADEAVLNNVNKNKNKTFPSHTSHKVLPSFFIFFLWFPRLCISTRMFAGFPKSLYKLYTGCFGSSLLTWSIIFFVSLFFLLSFLLKIGGKKSLWEWIWGYSICRCLN